MSVRTLKFGPMKPFYVRKVGKDGRISLVPGELGPDGLPVGEYMDIPNKTRVRIEALPSRNVVFDQKVSRSVNMDFDPGRYVYTMTKMLNVRSDGSPGHCARVDGEFLVDVTDAQYQQLLDCQPRLHRSSMTSEGGRWICTSPGCARESQTRIAAFLHEAQDHFGIDPLKNPDKASEVEMRAEEFKLSRTREKQARRAVDEGSMAPLPS